jgi:aryl-alcohol dehydrogenase-like predicted oxidoreductase
MTRRKFLKVAASVGAAASFLTRGVFAAEERNSMQVPKRPMGRTGLEVSIIGLGGYHLGSAKDTQTANNIVARAVDCGINFFDNAWEYHDGLSEKRVGEALKGKRDKVIVMTKVCTHGRDRKLAMKMLEESLGRLKTDHVDVWQIHEVVYDNDPELIFAKDGAADALLQAKKEGKARFIGFTGHKDPSIHLAMLQHDFPFDTVQMPINCMDANFRSFATHVLPEVNRRGIAALGMKTFGGSGEMVRHGAITPEEGLRYSMSQPVATTISGVDSMVVLEQNLAIAANFKPMTDAEMKDLRDRCRVFAADGRYELFKTSKKYDGKIGREQHHYPSQDELPI